MARKQFIVFRLSPFNCDVSFWTCGEWINTICRVINLVSDVICYLILLSELIIVYSVKTGFSLHSLTIYGNRRKSLNSILLQTCGVTIALISNFNCDLPLLNSIVINNVLLPLIILQL